MLTTHNKMLKSQIGQQANPFSTPPGRLFSKPGPNPKQHCNYIVLRSDKQSESPEGARVELESENSHDVSAIALPSEDEA